MEEQPAMMLEGKDVPLRYSLAAGTVAGLVQVFVGQPVSLSSLPSCFRCLTIVVPLVL
jgi:hypothetical protein